MKKTCFLVILLVILSGCSEKEGRQKIEGSLVERIIDGDTLALANGEKVRLVGINAPEKNEPCWEEAKKRLEELVLGKSVLLKRDVSDRDKYGRLVRMVYSEGKLVNLILVEEGLALSFEFEPDTSLLEEFQEAEAISSRAGGCIWKIGAVE